MCNGIVNFLCELKFVTNSEQGFTRVLLGDGPILRLGSFVPVDTRGSPPKAVLFGFRNRLTENCKISRLDGPFPLMTFVTLLA